MKIPRRISFPGRHRVARLCAVVLTFSCGHAFSQGAKTADQQWADVASLAAPAAVAKTANGKRKSSDEKKTDIAQAAARSRQAAQDARDFYTRFPSHAKAVEAKKVEALASVRGVETTNAAQAQAALSVAQAFRANSSLPPADRFEVALAMDRLKLSLEIKQKRAVDQPATWRKLADDLRKEFGDMAALQSYYIDLARRADNVLAVELANVVKSSSVATRDAKARAQSILDREALVGKKLNLKLPLVDGGTVDLAQPRTKPTVVFAWDASDPEILVTLRQHQTALQTADLVYLALGGTPATVRDAKQFLPLPGSYCHAAPGTSSRVAIEGLKLQYCPIPRVFLLDRAGLVIGSGPLQDLPALLKRAQG